MELNAYTFRDNEYEINHIVFARNEKVAQNIIDVANEMSPFKFELIKDYVRIMDSPFKSYEEAEKSQLEVELGYLKFRKARLN